MLVGGRVVSAKGPRLTAGRLTLSPIPTTAWATAPPCRADSTSTPPSLPPVCAKAGVTPGEAARQARTSLGHLRPVTTPLSSRAASAAATPAAIPRRGSEVAGNVGGGRRRTETAIEVRGGVSQGDFPARPRPAVWESATTTVPSGAPPRGEALRDVVGGRRLLQIMEGVPQGSAGEGAGEVAPVQGQRGLRGGAPRRRAGRHRRATTSRRVRAYHSTTLRKRSAGSAITPGLTPLILLLTAKSYVG